jgi:hypothetical protein
MKNEARKFWAEGVRLRKQLGDDNHLICPRLADYLAWAMRVLGLDGPKGKLP